MLPTTKWKQRCIEDIIRRAAVLTEDPDNPAVAVDGEWSVRIGHFNGTALYLEFQETLPTETMVIRLDDEPTTVIPVTRQSLGILSRESLRELRDCFTHTSYPSLKSGGRLHRELQSTRR